MVDGVRSSWGPGRRALVADDDQLVPVTETRVRRGEPGAPGRSVATRGGSHSMRILLPDHFAPELKAGRLNAIGHSVADANVAARRDPPEALGNDNCDPSAIAEDPEALIASSPSR